MSDVIRLSAPILLASDTLPALPADPSGLGRHVSWVELAKSPAFHYGSRKITVSAEWIAERVKFHNHMLSRGFYPPILIAHKDEGERAGDVIDVSSAMIEGRLTMIGALAWNDPEAAAKIKARQMTDVSVGLYPVQDPDTGEVMDMAIGEISLTTLPHLLGSSRILNAQNGGQPVPHLDEPGTDSELSLADRLLAMEANMTKLMDLVTEMVGGDDSDVPVDSAADIGLPAVTAAMDDEEEDELPIAASASKADSVLLTRLADLEAKLAAVEDEKAAAVFANGCPIGAKIVLTQAVADLLFPIWRDNPESLDVVKASIVKDEPVKVAPQTVPAPITMTSAWADSGIADDSAAPGGIYTKQDAFDEATTLSQQNKTTHKVEFKKLLKRVTEEM